MVLLKVRQVSALLSFLHGERCFILTTSLPCRRRKNVVMLGNYLIGLSHMHKAKNVTGYILILAMLAMMLIGYICVKVYNLTVII